MTNKELAIVALFEDKLKKQSLLDSYKYFKDKNFKPISPREIKDVLSKCKRAFYRRKSMKGTEIFGKLINKHGYETYNAIVKADFFNSHSESVMCEIEIVEDNKESLIINFISIYTGEIIQGIYEGN